MSLISKISTVLFSILYDLVTSVQQILNCGYINTYMFQMWRIDPYVLCIRTFNHIWNMYSYNHNWEFAVQVQILIGFLFGVDYFLRFQ